MTHFTAVDIAKALAANPDLELVDAPVEAPPRSLPGQSERALQAAVFAEAERRALTDARWGLLFHIPSGEYRRKATAGRLKAMGVKAGKLDLYLIYPNWQGKGGWACELKVGRNRPTPEQKAEMEYLLSVGWAAECIWDDAQAVIDSLERYLGEK